MIDKRISQTRSYAVVTTVLACVFFITTSILTIIVFSRSVDLVRDNLTKSSLLSLIESEYLGEFPSDEAIREAELKGLVNSLGDPFSEYLSESETEKFHNSINAKYEGIGVSFKEDNGVFSIDKIKKSSPADIAGIKAGDVLKSIDSEGVESLQMRDIVSKIKGAKGTKVKLEFYRATEVVEFEIIRSEIQSDLVTFEIDGEFALITISTFGNGTKQRLTEIASEIRSNQNIKGIILDLRSNTGGILSEGLGATSVFVDEGDIITYEVSKTGTRADKAESVKYSLKEYPIAILIDNFSASASEIMVAGIRDNREGVIIVGKKTYGKGVVQKLFQLPNNATVKLTVAEWLTPKKEKINKKGIDPSIISDSQNALSKAKEELALQF